MKVIFLQEITNVAKKYEIKDVSDGYARNFLLPRNLAKPATEIALKQVVAQKAREEKSRSGEHQKHQSMAAKLKEITLNFKVKIGEKGRAFGSVTPLKVQRALKKAGIIVEKDWVLLEDSIKTTGETKVKIKLPQGLAGEIKVVVEAET